MANVAKLAVSHIKNVLFFIYLCFAVPALIVLEVLLTFRDLLYEIALVIGEMVHYSVYYAVCCPFTYMVKKLNSCPPISRTNEHLEEWFDAQQQQSTEEDEEDDDDDYDDDDDDSICEECGDEITEDGDCSCSDDDDDDDYDDDDEDPDICEDCGEKIDDDEGCGCSEDDDDDDEEEIYDCDCEECANRHVKNDPAKETPPVPQPTKLCNEEFHHNHCPCQECVDWRRRLNIAFYPKDNECDRVGCDICDPTGKPGRSTRQQDEQDVVAYRAKEAEATAKVDQPAPDVVPAMPLSFTYVYAKEGSPPNAYLKLVAVLQKPADMLGSLALGEWLKYRNIGNDKFTYSDVCYKDEERSTVPHYTITSVLLPTLPKLQLQPQLQSDKVERVYVVVPQEEVKKPDKAIKFSKDIACFRMTMTSDDEGKLQFVRVEQISKAPYGLALDFEATLFGATTGWVETMYAPMECRAICNENQAALIYCVHDRLMFLLHKKTGVPSSPTMMEISKECWKEMVAFYKEMKPKFTGVVGVPKGSFAL